MDILPLTRFTFAVAVGTSIKLGLKHGLLSPFTRLRVELRTFFPKLPGTLSSVGKTRGFVAATLGRLWVALRSVKVLVP